MTDDTDGTDDTDTPDNGDTTSETHRCGSTDTTTGEPCQHRTTDPVCWMHAEDAPESLPTATPFDGPEDNGWDVEAVLDAARRGKSVRGCERVIGAGQGTVQKWIGRYDDFAREFWIARSEGESALIEGGLHDEDIDTSMAKFLLSTSFKYKKSEKREVEHSGGVDGFEFTINSKTSDTHDSDNADD